MSAFVVHLFDALLQLEFLGNRGAQLRTEIKKNLCFMRVLTIPIPVGPGISPWKWVGSLLPLSAVVVQRASSAVGGWGGGPPAVHHLQYVGFRKGGDES